MDLCHLPIWGLFEELWVSVIATLATMAAATRLWSFDLIAGPGEAPKNLARPLGFNPQAAIEVRRKRTLTD